MGSKTMSNPALAPARPTCSCSLPDSADLYRRHWQQVRRWVVQLGGPETDVEDATQEVFLLAHRERTRFRGDAQVTTWLYGIAFNVVRHHQRQQRRRWLRGSADEVAGHLAAPGPTPVDELEQRRWRERLRSALERLRESDRAIIVMFELDGLSGEEIAKLTAAKPATVWVRLHRARAQLLRELQG
jgi:RNA polymerase sigma factor (sigma-70 family)